MYNIVKSGAVRGVECYLIDVETDCADGLPYFTMVGFAGTEVREAGERVRVAMRNSGYRMDPKRITVNLAPANIPKRGIVIDLPVALGLLMAMGEIPRLDPARVLVLGELGLDGEIRPVRGALVTVRMAARQKIPLCILPEENLAEGCVIPGIDCAGVSTLRELVAFLNAPAEEQRRKIALQRKRTEVSIARAKVLERRRGTDLSAIRGQEDACRALEIAAAGFHNLYMEGPPGNGKSLLASCLPGILPKLGEEEALEVSEIYSAAGRIPSGTGLIRTRPFIAPHHTITRAALIGGGSVPGPGAISLAHGGVLFLDEMPEFSRTTLDLLRQPLEEREIRITRNYGTYRFPARFLLVGAGNPCPCGYYPDLNRCRCSEKERRRYRQHLSGPLMDRMDMRIHVRVTGVEEMQAGAAAGPSRSEAVRKRVEAAAERQLYRYRGAGIRFNAELDAEGTERWCRLNAEGERCMRDLCGRSTVSARGYHRILRIARTIADLDGAEEIRTEDLMEAFRLRGTE